MASSSRQVQYTIPSREEFNRLSEEQKTRITEAFELFDTNKDGWQTYEEFRFTLRALGFELPKAQTYELLQRHGLKPGGWPAEQECPPIYRTFNLATTQALAGSLVARRDPRDEARRAYRMFDVDGKGMITKEDLARVCAKIGNNMPESEMATMIEEFDASGKGGVNEDEFVRLMLTKK